jgi:hypothetical protein
MRYIKYLFVLLTLLCLLWLVFVFPDTLARLVVQQQMSDATHQPRPPYGPDISHCFDEGEQRGIWDCIRHVDQSTDP